MNTTELRQTLYHISMLFDFYCEHGLAQRTPTHVFVHGERHVSFDGAIREVVPAEWQKRVMDVLGFADLRAVGRWNDEKGRTKKDVKQLLTEHYRRTSNIVWEMENEKQGWR